MLVFRICTIQLRHKCGGSWSSLRMRSPCDTGWSELAEHGNGGDVFLEPDARCDVVRRAGRNIAGRQQFVQWECRGCDNGGRNAGTGHLLRESLGRQRVRSERRITGFNGDGAIDPSRLRYGRLRSAIGAPT